VEGEQAPQPAGRTPKSLIPSMPTRSTEEPSTQWFPLCAVPTPLLYLSRSDFGLAPPNSLDRAALAPSGLVETTVPSPGVPGPTKGAELPSDPARPPVADPTVVPPGEGPLQPETPAKPVILEGWMRDCPIQPDCPPPDATDAGSHPIVELKIEDRPANRVLCGLASTDRPKAQESAESAAEPSGQQVPDSDRRQKPDQARRQEPATSPTADSLWTAPHPAPFAARPGGLGQSGALTPTLDRPAAAHPATEPASEVASHQPQSITIRLQAPAGHPVDLRFIETRGDVKVTIRTEDPRLASAVASDLPALERGLESRGWSSEFRVPSRSSESRPIEEIRFLNHELAQPTVRSVGPGLDTSGQGPDPERRTDWAEEIEDRNVAAALRRLSILGGQL
jgi:hypothetical protein